MINLEWLKQNLTEEEKRDDVLCRVLYKKQNGKGCINVACEVCPFNTVGNLVEFLLKERKEAIKLTQFEYDLLLNCKEVVEEDRKDDDVIKNWWIVKGMIAKGHFKDVENLEMTFKEILENCEIVPDTYDFDQKEVG